MLTVKLSSVPNTDLNQTEAPAPSQDVELENLEQARAICLYYIAKHDLGAGNWSGGQVLENGIETHHVSYNGRIWVTE